MSEYATAIKKAKKSQGFVEALDKGLNCQEKIWKYIGDCLYALAVKNEEQTSPQVKQMTDALSEVRKTAEAVDKPIKRVRNFKNEPQDVDPETGEIIEKPLEKESGLPRGFMHTDDCPKGQDLCKISDRQATLSQIRFRKTFCEECFKDHG